MRTAHPGEIHQRMSESELSTRQVYTWLDINNVLEIC